MTNRITAADLEPGDVLLSLGDSDTSKAIRAFDGGRYSHAALWMGETVLESTTPHVVEHALEESLRKHPRIYVDAFRHRTLGGKQVAIVEKARAFEKRTYSYGDLALGAVVMVATRWRPSHEWQVKVLTTASGLSDFLRLDQERQGELVTCTELVVRAYGNAAVPIRIDPVAGNQVDRPAVRSLLKAIWELTRGSMTRFTEVEDPDLSEAPLSEEELLKVEALWRQAQESFRQQYSSLAGVEFAAASELLEFWDGVSIVTGTEYGANLVTPRHLQESPDLEFKGRVYPGEEVVDSSIGPAGPLR